METLLGIALLAAVPLVIVAFVVTSWRRSERDRQRWESRRGGDEKQQGDGDSGAYRSHWGGMGGPGGGGAA